MTRKRKLKRNKDKNRIITGALINMLKKVHLGGAINECLLQVHKGQGHIEAVDMTGNLIIISDQVIWRSSDSEDLGLGNVELLIKFLGTLNDEKTSFKIEDLVFLIQRKDKRRKLTYQLSEPETIATRLVFEDDDDEEENAYEQIMEMVEYKADLTQNLVKDYLSYVTMTKQKDTRVVFKDDTVIFKIGEHDDHKIELVLENETEEIDDPDGDEFSVQVNGDHLSKIFSIIEFDDEDPPTISLSSKDGAPVIIQSGSEEDEQTTWSLLPLSDMEMEEE